MKKITFSALAVAVAIAMFSFIPEKGNLSQLSGSELKKWSNRNDSIFKNDTVVAMFDHYEYEYNPNHKHKVVLYELCLTQIDDEPDNTIDLIRYMHTLHPTSKVQISFDKSFQ
jgi:hypothetical protein